MTDIDPQLQSLFKPESIDDGGFTLATMDKILAEEKLRQIKTAAIWAAIAVVLVTIVAYFGVAEFITHAMTSPIYDVGEGWVGWLLSPINNAGALLIALLKLFQVVRGGGRGLDRVSLLPF